MPQAKAAIESVARLVLGRTPYDLPVQNLHFFFWALGTPLDSVDSTGEVGAVCGTGRSCSLRRMRVR
jgi:hypothetical protein